MTGPDDELPDGFFEAVLGCAADAFIVLDPNGIIRWASPAAETFAGVPARELVGHSPLEFIDPDAGEVLAQGIGEMIATDDNGGLTRVALRRPDGTTIPIEVTTLNRLDDPVLGGLVSQIHAIPSGQVLDDFLAAARSAATLGR